MILQRISSIQLVQQLEIEILKVNGNQFMLGLLQFKIQGFQNQLNEILEQEQLRQKTENQETRSFQ
jgi:hypothetical protein